MAKRTYDPERDLRAWADALNAVADLQHAIVEVASEYNMMLDDWLWLEPYREIVERTHKYPLQATLAGAVEALQNEAMQALARLREEAPKHPAKQR